MCYLLNQKVSDGTQVWYQNLSGQNADAYPVLKKMTIVRYIMDTKNVQEYIRIKAVYTGADAANYEMTIVEVEVQRSKCRHNLDKVTAAAATEVQEGNKEYYICKERGKLFEDAQGMLEITKESTVTPKLEKNSQVSETPKPTETLKPTETPKLTKIPEDTVASVQILPALIQPIVSQKRKQIINWKKVKGADGYFVYASRCNDKKEIRKLQRIVIISSPGKTSYVNRKLKKIPDINTKSGNTALGTVRKLWLGVLYKCMLLQKATVYAIAQNGAMAKVKVIVRN